MSKVAGHRLASLQSNGSMAAGRVQRGSLLTWQNGHSHPQTSLQHFSLLPLMCRHDIAVGQDSWLSWKTELLKELQQQLKKCNDREKQQELMEQLNAADGTASAAATADPAGNSQPAASSREQGASSSGTVVAGGAALDEPATAAGGSSAQAVMGPAADEPPLADVGAVPLRADDYSNLPSSLKRILANPPTSELTAAKARQLLDKAQQLRLSTAAPTRPQG